MDTIKVYIEYNENELTLTNEFNINKNYERYYNEYEKNIYFKEKKLIIINLENIIKSNYFITKIIKWCDSNNNLFSNEPELKLTKINFYDKDKSDDNYIKYSIIKNELLNNNNQCYNIVNLSYKFMYNNILYNDNIHIIINTNYKNNSLNLFINSILIHISYNEYNKKFNTGYLKLEYLNKTKEELNQLIESYNSEIKKFLTNYDKKYKEIEEKNYQFKVILNQDLNQRFETIEHKIKKVSESTERNNDKIMLLVDKTLREKLINIPKTEDVKQISENLSKLHNINKLKKDIENITISVENKLTEIANKSVKDNKELIEEYQKNNKTTFSKLKSEYTKLTNDLNDHYKELLKIHDKENNNQIVYYQKSIENLSSMNKMLIFMILVCYYIFLFIKYYY